MNRNRSITLDDRSAAFVDRQVQEGHYHSATEVVQAGLRLLEAQEADLAAIRAALIEGENSGPPQPFDFNAFIARKHRERGL